MLCNISICILFVYLLNTICHVGFNCIIMANYDYLFILAVYLPAY